jgi:hypothetical protein
VAVDGYTASRGSPHVRGIEYVQFSCEARRYKYLGVARVKEVFLQEYGVDARRISYAYYLPSLRMPVSAVN